MIVPGFMELFKERAEAPFFVIKVFYVGLWCLTEYWYYSIFVLFMLTALECIFAYKQFLKLPNIRKIGNVHFPILAYRNRKWKFISSLDLVPGDIVSIRRSQQDNLVPCDLLLLRGSCIVDEYIGSRRPPPMKEPIEELDPNDVLDVGIEHFDLHILYAGSKILDLIPPGENSLALKRQMNLPAKAELFVAGFIA